MDAVFAVPRHPAPPRQHATLQPLPLPLLLLLLQVARTRKQTSPAIYPHMNRLALTETLTWSAP